VGETAARNPFLLSITVERGRWGLIHLPATHLHVLLNPKFCFSLKGLISSGASHPLQMAHLTGSIHNLNSVTGQPLFGNFNLTPGPKKTLFHCSKLQMALGRNILATFFSVNPFSCYFFFFPGKSDLKKYLNLPPRMSPLHYYPL
jgi:hypothetical protein